MTIRDISSVRRCTLPVSKLLDGGHRELLLLRSVGLRRDLAGGVLNKILSVPQGYAGVRFSFFTTRKPFSR